MKKVIATTVLAVSLVGMTAPSYAMGWFQKASSHAQQRNTHTNTTPNKNTPPKTTDNSKSVPEIDAAGAAIALALLGGVVAISRERRKKQS